MKTIAVTGAAGYIGSMVARQALEKGYKVVGIDRLMFGGDAIVDLLSHPHFRFVKADLRTDSVQAELTEVEGVIHLAAIVGDPACSKEPDLARATNVDAGKKLFQDAKAAGVKRFIFSSTCSNYGRMADPTKLINEESELRPISLYAETKVEFESFLMEQPETEIHPTVLRFSTVYGLSSRLRFDLTVNEFTKELALGRELVIFGEQFWRPYCHVYDLAKSTFLALEAPVEKVSRQVFNVGHTEENYQKQMIVEEIKKFLPESQIKYVKKDEDPRDYRVSFDKIKAQLGFETTYRVPDGIRQILEGIRGQVITDPDNAKFKNVN